MSQGTTPPLRTACVTGTNGKTTTTSMIAAVVAASGEVAARVTTLGAWVGDELISEDATSEAFAEMVRRAGLAGVKTLSIETTSQALAEGFASAWPAEVGVFTNLSRDHLDYHGTPEHYLAAKAQLFLSLAAGATAVLNAADPASALLDEVTGPGVRRLGYAARPVAPECSSLPLSLSAERVEVSASGTLVRLAPSPAAESLAMRLSLRVVGGVHAENALAAALACLALGYAPSAVKAGLESFEGVAGRFQIVHREPLVVVDFAHTPDALSKALSLARALVAPRGGRVVCVFGCGGDRDRGKRPEMGRTAADLADTVIVTSDNPRSEDPRVIAAEVLSGAVGGGARVEQEPDRARAIARGIEAAGPYDIVVVAGKGHEKTQTVGDRLVPFDDAEVARGILSRPPTTKTREDA